MNAPYRTIYRELYNASASESSASRSKSGPRRRGVTSNHSRSV